MHTKEDRFCDAGLSFVRIKTDNQSLDCNRTESSVWRYELRPCSFWRYMQIAVSTSTSSSWWSLGLCVVAFCLGLGLGRPSKVFFEGIKIINLNGHLLLGVVLLLVFCCVVGLVVGISSSEPCEKCGSIIRNERWKEGVWERMRFYTNGFRACCTMECCGKLGKHKIVCK